MSDWKIFQGDHKADSSHLQKLPSPPSWRPSDQSHTENTTARKPRGAIFQAGEDEIELVNAALYLRRPLLVTGNPGTGKSSLAYAVAYELGLGEVLYWPITTRTVLKDGLYRYDAIARLQDAQREKLDNLKNIGKYIQLGPLGTALLPSEPKRPRILLIDEIDKSDIDLPNDLLCIFEEGGFEIPELTRIRDELDEVEIQTFYTEKGGKTDCDRTASLKKGRIQCTEFPFIVLTSNGERDFPAPFLRRCVRLTMKEPGLAELEKIVEAHLGEVSADAKKLIQQFFDKRNAAKDRGNLATDQLLNAIYLITKGQIPAGQTREDLIERLLKPLSSSEDV